MRPMPFAEWLCGRCKRIAGGQDVVTASSTNNYATGIGELICQGCHDPHNTFDNPDRHQLRIFDDVVIGDPAAAGNVVLTDAVDAALFVTLEFLEDPARALAEAVRVCRTGLMLLVLNRWSLGGLSRRLGPQASQTILGHARDYSLWSLRSLVRTTAAERLQGLHCRYGCLPRDLVPSPSRLPVVDVIALAARLAQRTEPG